MRPPLRRRRVRYCAVQEGEIVSEHAGPCWLVVQVCQYNGRKGMHDENEGR